MKKKNAKTGIFKKIMKMLTAVLVMAAIVAAFISGQQFKKDRTCTGIRTLLTDNQETKFITPEDVSRIVLDGYGEIRDSSCREINLAEIEQLLDSQDVIRSCEVYFTRDGILNVNLCEREPIFRIQTDKGGFYVDPDGVMIPLQKKHTAKVPVIDGKVPVGWREFENKSCSTKEQQQWLQGTIELVTVLRSNEDWKGKISQIHCTDKYGMILIPKEGRERFVIGEPVEVEKKIRKMGKYYTHIKPANTEKNYRKIDLRYDGQIICK